MSQIKTFFVILFLLVLCDFVFCQQNETRFLISGGAEFFYEKSNDNQMFGDVNTYRYSMISRIVRESMSQNHFEKALQSGLGIILQLRNFDQISDSLSVYERFLSFSPFFRVTAWNKVFLDFGISAERYLKTSKSEYQGVIFKKVPPRTNYYMFFEIGYLLKVKENFYISPVVNFPVYPSSNLFSNSGWRQYFFIEFNYTFYR
jgi:hypothetical protein